MATAGELVDEARDYHSAFHKKFGGSLAPVRRLSRIQQAYAGALAVRDPEILAVKNVIDAADIATALAGDDPIVVPAYITILDRVWATKADSIGGGVCEVRRVPRLQQYNPGAPFPSIATSNEAFTLTDLRKVGQTEHGWEDFLDIWYSYVALPAELTTLQSPITLPDGMHGALVAQLALWMGRRIPLATNDLVELKDDLRDMLPAFMETVGQQNHGDSWNVADGGETA